MVKTGDILICIFGDICVIVFYPNNIFENLNILVHTYISKLSNYMYLTWII